MKPMVTVSGIMEISPHKPERKRMTIINSTIKKLPRND